MKELDVLHALHDDAISLDEISESIPGMLHVNNVHDFKPIYIDPKSIERLGLNVLKDFKAEEGLSFVHKDDLDHAIEITRHYLANVDDYKTISFTQRILNPKTGQYEAYYTTSKLIKNRGGLVSFSVPIGNIFLDNNSIDQIISETNFMRRHMNDFATLTKRELELVKLWVNKRDNQAIMESMGISINTIKSYKKSVYRKLGINQYNRLFEYAKAFEVI